ncbi:SMP-30/gluconolactonase/LRE family protein [Singulisphaera sp. Ch08]
MNAIRLQIGVLSAWTVIGLMCRDAPAEEKKEFPSLGTIERKDPRLDRLVPSGARIERLAGGYDWSEGPVWDRKGRYLLFSDVPQNTVFRWKEGEGASVYLKPSGYTGSEARGGEPGSNGLAMDAQGRLILCQHGDRCIARLEPDGKFKVLADGYEGKRFNSPNDAVFKSNGDLYFTDPPYGLLGKNDDPKKELKFNGVFRLSKDGKVTLLTDKMTYPNGIAFSPDEKTLYVANSDPEQAIWMAYDVQQDGTLGQGKVFFDATPFAKNKALKGLPDGLKVDQKGNIFATAPGGVFIFSPDGSHLGTLATGEANGNCAWGDDGSTLYVNADMYLARIRLTTKGLGF